MRRFFRNYRIDYVLFISFSGFIIILLALVVGISYRVSAADRADSTSAAQQGMLHELNRQLAVQLRGIEQTSLAISQNGPFLDLLSDKRGYYEKWKLQDDVNKNYLSPIAYSSPFIQSLQVFMEAPPFTDREADVQFLSADGLREEAWYASAGKADFTWYGEHTIPSLQGDVPVVSFIRQILSRDQKPVGYLVINVKRKVLQATIAEDQPAPRRLVLDSGGRFLFGTDLAPRLQDLDGALDSIRSNSGFRRLQLDFRSQPGEKDVLMVWSRSFPEGWVLVELTPWREITATPLKLALTLGLIGFLAVIAALFYTLALSRQFTRPILELVKRMGRYSIDRSMEPYPDDYRNEFGSLFNGYRKLTDRIDELYHSLELQYRAQKEAEIRALQAMINPHFLYNTLDQLNWMAIDAGQERMSQVLELMGRMFRIGLSNGESFITLQEELEHTECYLRIQQLKRGNTLTYAAECADAWMECYIPKLTLQPFVENAVMHGLHGRTKGFVGIRVEGSAEGLRIRITDDGVGLPEDWSKARRRRTGGYGIRNVTERMEAYFGPPYGVSLKALPEGGTVVEIRIPHLTEKPGSGAGERSGRHVDDSDCG